MKFGLLILIHFENGRHTTLIQFWRIFSILNLPKRIRVQNDFTLFLTCIKITVENHNSHFKGGNPVGKKVCDCSVHHGPIRKYDEMACKWILLIPPSCNPVIQPVQSGSIYNQATAVKQQQQYLNEQYSNFQQFHSPQQFNIPPIQRQIVPRAYPPTQLPSAYHGNPRVPPFQEYNTNSVIQGRVVKRPFFIFTLR